MFFIALDVYGAERAGGAQVFARAAAYAAGGVDNGYFGRVGILRVETYQFLSLGAEAVSLTPEELQQVSEDFESGLDKLIRLAWSARKAATAWPMGG